MTYDDYINFINSWSYDMVQLAEVITQQEPEARKAFDLLPKGYYKAIALTEEEKATNAGDGSYIKMEFEITSPPEFAKRKIWNNFNIINKNPAAEKIAREQLGHFAWAANVKELRDTNELLLKEITIEVGVQPAKGTYSESNSIKGFFPASFGHDQIEAHKKRKGGDAAPAQQAQAAPEPARKPWLKK